MRKLVVSILFVSLTAFSQSGENAGKLAPRVRADRPMTFLDYVCQDKKMVYLRMYNNTIWALAVKSDELYYNTKHSVKLANGKEFYAMPNDKVTSLQYRVDRFASPWEKVNAPKILPSDNGSMGWIASQDSVLFSVPLEYLRDKLEIVVRFNYEWEMTEQGFFNSLPEHRVLFRGIDIPDSQRECKGL